MLAGPDRVHPAVVGNLAQLDHLVVKPLLRLGGVDPFHVDEKREFHGVFPSATLATRPAF
jgi:hypothetical protein